jgi:hypothetical protein
MVDDQLLFLSKIYIIIYIPFINSFIPPRFKNLSLDYICAPCSCLMFATAREAIVKVKSIIKSTKNNVIDFLFQNWMEWSNLSKNTYVI